MPQRIQRKRTKGWRMPAGAISVGRPSAFGNPAMIEVVPSDRERFTVYAGDVGPIIGSFLTRSEAHQRAVRWFRWWIQHTDGTIWSSHNLSHAYADAHRQLTERLPELAGHDLACWCPLELECHADVLLELANR